MRISFRGEPAPGNHVAFSQVKEGEKGFVANNVNRIQPSVGTVENWNRKAGEGTIVLEGSDNVMTFSRRNVLCPKDQEFQTGATVSFIVPDSAAKAQAICVKKEYPLRCFASFADESVMLDELAAKVLPGERWDYRNSIHPSKYPILHNYLLYTFQRLNEEDDGQPPEKRKIKTACSDGGTEKASFNTGLVDHTYRPIFAAFSKRAEHKPGQPIWDFDCFVTRGEKVRGRSYMAMFRDLPERAVYFTDPNDVVYDSSLRLDAVTDHIIGDQGGRLPRRLRDRIPKDMKNPDDVQAFLADHLQMAIERALERIKWNYKTAVPQYYFPHQRIQLLLPLCIDDPRRVDLAIAVEREGGAYVGRTILELDWAYSNARLLARPDSDWLSPEVIQAEEEIV
jgi:cold shock CspA family protein